jgi:Big-like domain-containing protein
VRRWVFLLSSVAWQGCSNLTEGAGGVAGLEIRAPAVKTIEVGETLQLSVVALDKDGNTVSVPVTWQAPDATLTVDGSTGAITGVSPGTGQVQAFAGSLASELVTFNVIIPADTLVITGDSVLTVAPGVTASVPLLVELRSLPTDDPLPSLPVVYAVTSPPRRGASHRRASGRGADGYGLDWHGWCCFLRDPQSSQWNHSTSYRHRRGTRVPHPRGGRARIRTAVHRQFPVMRWARPRR